MSYVSLTLRFFVAHLLIPRFSIGFPGGLESNIPVDNNKIINAQKLWSWLVRIQITGLYTEKTQTCHGVAISDIKIITAAHCFVMEDEQIQIAVILVPIGIEEDGVQRNFTINNGFRTVVHPAYDYNRKLHDIAVLQFEHPLPYMTPLPPSSLSPVNLQFELLVSASVYHYEDNRDIQRHTRVSILTLDECSEHHSNVDKDTQLCASDPLNSIYLGDSGSPLICYDKGFVRLCGIVSYGSSRHSIVGKASRVVYTKLGPYLNWLNNNIPSRQLKGYRYPSIYTGVGVRFVVVILSVLSCNLSWAVGYSHGRKLGYHSFKAVDSHTSV